MNKNLRNDIGNAFSDTTYAYVNHHVSEDVICVRTDEWDLAGDVWHMEKLAHRLIEATEPPFTLKINKLTKRPNIHPNKLGKQILLALKTDITALRGHYAMHAFNPYVDEFIKLASEHNLFGLPYAMTTLGDDEVIERLEALNLFVAEFQAMGTSTEFQTIINDFARSPNKNKRELCKLIDRHFEDTSRMLVLRVDFGYKKAPGWPCVTDNSISYEEAKAHRKALNKYLKKAFPPKSFQTWACKMEYGLDKKWHFHVLLLLNGSLVREDVTIARMIGEHWNSEITEGKGLYWNCNAFKDTYKSCGIGMISHDDVAGREGLEKAVVYMTKPDYYAKLLVPGNDRTFWKGNMPKPKSEGSGRPRTKGMSKVKSQDKIDGVQRH
ncbi:MAG: inovirus-type Gp2 protein [Burkholderiaceae bacterium]|nr:inovirus-type Gp2 protein [Burkholderiaceae bacterium]